MSAPGFDRRELLARIRAAEGEGGDAYEDLLETEALALPRYQRDVLVQLHTCPTRPSRSWAPAIEALIGRDLVLRRSCGDVGLTRRGELLRGVYRRLAS